MSERKIILLSDIIETRVRKENELEYSQRQLDELQRKMFFVKKEIDLTNVIIDIIEHEKVIDIKEYVYDKIESKYE
jgi:hypothetical protein